LSKLSLIAVGQAFADEIINKKKLQAATPFCYYPGIYFGFINILF